MSTLDVGTLSGRIELEDKMSSTLDLLDKKINELDERFGGLGKHVAESAAGFFTAEAAMEALKEGAHLAVETFKDLTTEGAVIADVERNFNRLTTNAGQLGSELLGTLSEGLHSTVTNFELMKTVNKDLAAGLQLTSDQYDVLTRGSFALAQATGGDVKQALDIVNDAMLTGRTRSLQLLTGKIDLTGAERDFAAALGTTADKLSEEGKLQSARNAILESVAKATERLGEQTDGLDEKVAQARTQWANFYEDIAKSVATSPSVIRAFDTIRDAVVGAFGGDSEERIKTVVEWINTLADKVTEYAPTVVQGFVDIKDWVVKTYEAVINSWNALPDWLKNVASNTILTVVGIKLVDSAVGAVTRSVSDFLGVAGNMTTWLSGMPTAVANVNGALASLKLLAGLTALEFTSLSAAGASFSLLGGAIYGMVGPLGVATAYAALLYGAFELGKWQPISDFFMKWSLVLEGYSRAEADAMVATDKTTQAEAAKAKAAEASNTEVDKAKSLIAGLTEAMSAANATTEQGNADLDKQRFVLSATNEEIKKYIEGWKELESVGETFVDTLKSLSAEQIATVKYYVEAGVSVDKLAAAFPNLTKSQIEAVAASVKSANDIKSVWADTEGIIAAMHGNNINEWIKGERTKLTVTLEAARTAGQLTQAFLDAEMAKFNATVAAEIHGRENQSAFTRNYYAKQLDDAKNSLDLMLLNSEAHTNEEIRNARFEVAEKQRILDHWRFYADQAYTDHTKTVKDETGKQKQAIEGAVGSWQHMGDQIDMDSQKVQLLSGEIVTMKEKAERLARGNSITYDLSDKAGIDFYKKMNPGAQINMGEQQLMEFFKKGGTLQQLIQNGTINPYGNWGAGNGMPSFANGGYGDFGGGTPAMLHGKEFVTPESQMQAMFDALNEKQAAMWRSTGGVVDAAQERIIAQMEAMKMPGYFGQPESSKAPDVIINVTSHDADHTARLVEDYIISKAYNVRKFGSAVR
jgi:hypothetical protein